MLFEWDEDKAAANWAKHSVAFAFACRVFADRDRLEIDASRASDDARTRKRKSSMPIVRMTSKRARTVRLTPAEKARLDALTDAEITAAALSDPDNPPLTAEEFARARRVGRPPKAPEDRKRLVTLRLSPQVLSHFKRSGPGWQTRIAEILQDAAGRKAKIKKRKQLRAAKRVAKPRRRA
jgi:uncharacterized protein (DUF4415 family)